MPRTGVFICHCGTNIAGTVDIARAIEASRNFPGVVHADEYRYLCSEMGQDLIKNAIKELWLAPARRACMKALFAKRLLKQGLTLICWK